MYLSYTLLAEGNVTFGPVDPVVDRRGFTGLAKPPVKADLAIHSPIIGTCGYC